jgi:hypothetical protein
VAYRALGAGNGVPNGSREGVTVRGREGAVGGLCVVHVCPFRGPSGPSMTLTAESPGTYEDSRGNMRAYTGPTLG